MQIVVEAVCCQCQSTHLAYYDAREGCYLMVAHDFHGSCEGSGMEPQGLVKDERAALQRRMEEEWSDIDDAFIEF